MNPEKDASILVQVISGAICLFGIFAFWYLVMTATGDMPPSVADVRNIVLK